MSLMRAVLGVLSREMSAQTPQDDNGREKPRSAKLTGLGNSVRWCGVHLWSPRQESNLHLALRRHLFYPLNYGEMDISAGGPKPCG